MQLAVLRGSGGVDDRLVYRQVQPQLFAPRCQRLERADRRAESAAVAADGIVRVAYPSIETSRLSGTVRGLRSQKSTMRPVRNPFVVTCSRAGR